MLGSAGKYTADGVSVARRSSIAPLLNRRVCVAAALVYRAKYPILFFLPQHLLHKILLKVVKSSFLSCIRCGARA